MAARRTWRTHSIWELVLHLTAELDYARGIIEVSAGPWSEGETTWPSVTDASSAAWNEAIEDLTRAHRALVRAVKQLDDSILDQKPVRVGGTFYKMLHGTLQHNIYHSGQIALLARQTVPED
jgi:uncharacterized damage-inducible protein DinB